MAPSPTRAASIREVGGPLPQTPPGAERSQRCESSHLSVLGCQRSPSRRRSPTAAANRRTGPDHPKNRTKPPPSSSKGRPSLASLRPGACAPQPGTFVPVLTKRSQRRASRQFSVHSYRATAGHQSRERQRTGPKTPAAQQTLAPNEANAMPVTSSQLSVVRPKPPKVPTTPTRALSASAPDNQENKNEATGNPAHNRTPGGRPSSLCPSVPSSPRLRAYLPSKRSHRDRRRCAPPLKTFIRQMLQGATKPDRRLLEPPRQPS